MKYTVEQFRKQGVLAKDVLQVLNDLESITEERVKIVATLSRQWSQQLPATKEALNDGMKIISDLYKAQGKLELIKAMFDVEGPPLGSIHA